MAERDDNIHAGHRERLRMRLRASGMGGFSDHEVLELLLMYAIPMRDVNPLAHALIDRFGSLANVLDADENELMRVSGVGANTALLLSMMPALMGKYRQSKLGEKFVITNFQQARSYCRTLFSAAHDERLYAICMDKGGRVLHPALLSRGTLDEVPIYPRQIVEVALRYRAYNLLLAHNHPGGYCAASQADIDSTVSIARALKLINVNVIDHIVICGDEAYSMMNHCPFTPDTGAQSYVLRSPGPADRAALREGDVLWRSMDELDP